MGTPIVPSTPAFDANGTPFSTHYGDIYHSADSGPGQARHVFLGGNDLPARWAGARAFTILETGFGLGLNFLATWQGWREDPSRPDRLHFVSIEKHPFERAGLAELHARYPEFAPLGLELQSAWPLPLPGLHRLHFEGGRITLTVAFADVAQAMPRLRLAADACYLDGFAPDRNAEMWAPPVLKALARLARPGATLATYTTARAVRDALTAAGFALELRPGFGRKRRMLAARRLPRGAAASVPAPAERSALVIGAGLAGAAVTERLAARGWCVTLLERHGGPAREASAIPAGVFHPHVSRDDSILSRLTRAGYLYALERWRGLEAAGFPLQWQQCGVLQVAKDSVEESRMAEAARALRFPPAYLEYLAGAAASDRAGRAVRAGGWWYPASGWMEPGSLVAAQIASRPQAVLHAGVPVHALARDDRRWHALAANGAVLASAPVAVLANANDAARLAALGAPLKRVRGQLSRLPGARFPGLRAVLAGAGHLIAGAPGGAVLGSTYDFDDDSPAPQAAGHAANLRRLEQLLPGGAAGLDPDAFEGSVGFRCVAADRLPLIGALPDADSRPAKPPTRLIDLPRAPGLYGALGYASRGLIWAALGGELLASLVEGDPLPLEGDLADAIDPARFLLRRARRGVVNRQDLQD